LTWAVSSQPGFDLAYVELFAHRLLFWLGAPHA
jgi:hypothetical protein